MKPTMELETTCRFCLDSKMLHPSKSEVDMAESNIPHLYEVVTNTKVYRHHRKTSRNMRLKTNLFQLYISTSEYPIYICLNCISQMELVDKIRKDFLRAADFWKGQISDFLKVEISSGASATLRHGDNDSIEESLTDDVDHHHNDESTSSGKIKAFYFVLFSLKYLYWFYLEEIVAVKNSKKCTKLRIILPKIKSYECDICGEKDIAKRYKKKYKSEHTRD